ncbi:MAG TPA: sigma-70 family RNA polymerase sigma factor [Anaerolineales bacterium]|nr:sigma-70 family RNA polymerase sigma factor [Anaerolineales bacterium]
MQTDRELLDAAGKMDKEALVRIFDLYSPALFNYAWRLCGDPVLADHIVGDVFASLLEKLAAGKGPSSNLRSYLFEITYHRIVDEARYAKRRAPIEAAALLPRDHYSAFLAVEDQILYKQILHVFQQELTEDQRHVILLRFLEEFSLRETASILSKTVENVKVIQLRALARLRQCLRPRHGKTLTSPQVRRVAKASGA